MCKNTEMLRNPPSKLLGLRIPLQDIHYFIASFLQSTGRCNTQMSYSLYLDKARST